MCVASTVEIVCHAVRRQNIQISYWKDVDIAFFALRMRPRISPRHARVSFRLSLRLKDSEFNVLLKDSVQQSQLIRRRYGQASHS